MSRHCGWIKTEKDMPLLADARQSITEGIRSVRIAER